MKKEGEWEWRRRGGSIGQLDRVRMRSSALRRQGQRSCLVVDARDVRHGITPFGWKGSFILPGSGRSTDILIPSLSRSIAVTTDGVDLPKAPLQFINREATADQVDGGRDAEGKKAEQGRRSRNQAAQKNGRWRCNAFSSSSDRDDRKERPTTPK